MNSETGFSTAVLQTKPDSNYCGSVPTQPMHVRGSRFERQSGNAKYADAQPTESHGPGIALSTINEALALTLGSSIVLLTRTGSASSAFSAWTAS